MKTRLIVASTVASAALTLLGIGAADAGNITGTVSFDGEAPQRRQVKMAADPQCEAANPDGRLGEVFVVNDGKLQNVFVHLKEGVAEKEYEVPEEAVKIDQIGCMYTPRVTGVMVGQTVEIINSDATLHNVHSLAENTKQFNNAMPMKDMVIKKRFTEPELLVRMKCDVHPWMASYIGVLDHPFFATSGEDGTFTISDVPAGEYTIEAWHEKMGTMTQTVTVADGDATADFSFKPKPKE